MAAVLLRFTLDSGQVIEAIKTTADASAIRVFNANRNLKKLATNQDLVNQLLIEMLGELAGNTITVERNATAVTGITFT